MKNLGIYIAINVSERTKAKIRKVKNKLLGFAIIKTENSYSRFLFNTS